MENLIAIEVVDPDPSYDFFGKTVCVSGIAGFTPDQVLDEALYLGNLFPHCSLRYVESIPAAV